MEKVQQPKSRIIEAIERPVISDRWTVYSNDNPLHIPQSQRIEAVVSGMEHIGTCSYQYIADTYRVDIDWLYDFVAAHDLDPDIENRTPDTQLPGYVAAISEDEVKWQRKFSNLPDVVSLSYIARTFDRQPAYILSKMTEIGLEVGRKENIKGVSEYEYEIPKRFMDYIRKLQYAVPWDDCMAHPDDIARKTGKSLTWVEARIREQEIYLSERRSRDTKRVGQYVALDDANRILEIARALPEEAPEGWRTARSMRLFLERSESWVSTKLADYGDVAMIMLDRIGRPKTHYPDWVFQDLLKESKRQKLLPAIGDRITYKELVSQSGKSDGSVRRILGYLGLSGEERINNAGRAAPSYDAADVEAVREFDLNKLKPSLESRMGEAAILLAELYVKAEDLRDELRLLGETDDGKRTSIQSDLQSIAKERKKLYERRAYLKKRIQEAASRRGNLK